MNDTRNCPPWNQPCFWNYFGIILAPCCVKWMTHSIVGIKKTHAPGFGNLSLNERVCFVCFLASTGTCSHFETWGATHYNFHHQKDCKMNYWYLCFETIIGECLLHGHAEIGPVGPLPGHRVNRYATSSPEWIRSYMHANALNSSVMVYIVCGQMRLYI